jgi:hypothetical protein
MTQPDLFLIAGIPGSGKTTFGGALATGDLGFIHYDLEDMATLGLWDRDPTGFVQTIVRQKRNAVVTWGFAPDHERSVLSVLDFRSNGFKLVWFDGDRPAAFRRFLKRGDVPEICLYAQMYKIEHTKIIDRIGPAVVNPFDAHGEFRAVADLLQEIRAASTSPQNRSKP